MAYQTIDPGDAAAARRAATSLTSAARQLRATSQLSGGVPPGLEWTGPIRDEVVAALQTEAVTLEGLAGDADTLAGRLEGHAAWIDRKTAHLDRLRDRVRQFANSHPEHPFSIEFATAAEPPRWNTRWEDLYRRSGSGVYVVHTPSSVVL